MTIVENRAKAGFFTFVLLDDQGLEFATTSDDFFENNRVTLQQLRHDRFKVFEERSVQNHAVFHDFGESGQIFALRQRRERCQIDEHAGRLPERADHA